MTNKSVIEYVQNTPYNTNPAILNQMLKEQDYDSQEGQYDLIFEYEGQVHHTGSYLEYPLENLRQIPKEKFQAIIDKIEKEKFPKILFRLIGNIHHSPRHYIEVPMNISFYSENDIICYAPIYFDEEGLVNQIIKITFNENGPLSILGL